MKKFFGSKSKSNKESNVNSSKESCSYYGLNEKDLAKIYRAAWSGDIKKLQSFTNDVNLPDQEKRTALHLACANGQDKSVQALLSMGADPSARDKEGKMPLYRAVEAKHSNCIKLMLKMSPQLAQQQSTNQMLHLAVQNSKDRDEKEKDKETLVALLTSVKEVDATDDSGRTPLMLACEAGKDFLAALLIEKGANVQARDDNGRTCSDYAKSHPACQKILDLRAGGSAVGSKPGSRQLTPRNRTSDDYEEDESKSTDYDIPVQMSAAAKRSKALTAAADSPVDLATVSDSEASESAKVTASTI